MEKWIRLHNFFHTFPLHDTLSKHRKYKLNKCNSLPFKKNYETILKHFYDSKAFIEILHKSKVCGFSILFGVLGNVLFTHV